MKSEDENAKILLSADHQGRVMTSKAEGWEQQKAYKGDVINSYNDGPFADGNQMGFFYDIKSSSPLLQWKKDETGEYKQITCHIQGDYNALQQLAQQLPRVDLNKIKK